MPEENFRTMVKKKILELKSDATNFYTETYNLVAVLSRLTPEAPPAIEQNIARIYNVPNIQYPMTLSQCEDIYFKYRGDFELKIKGTHDKVGLHDIKATLDKVRRDLLFYMALLEEPRKDYDIIARSVDDTNNT